MKKDPRKQFMALPLLEEPRSPGKQRAEHDSENKQYYNNTNIMDTVTKTPSKDVHNGTVNNGPFITPEVNIFETKDSYVLEAELPGVNKDGLEITLEGNELTILGRRERFESNAELLYRESSVAGYRRVFELDPAIDTAKINANVEQGVLTLHLPKSERVKPRKVTVSD